MKLKKKKKIDKEILDHIVSAVVFTLILIALTVVITLKFIDNNVQRVYVENGFMIQLNPKISKTLDVLTDIEGLNSESYSINITNNNNEEKRYVIILTPLNDDDKDIRVAIDNAFLRSLSNFEKKDNSYLLRDFPLSPGQTRLHTIKVWQDKQIQNKKINVNFKLEVKIIN